MVLLTMTSSVVEALNGFSDAEHMEFGTFSLYPWSDNSSGSSLSPEKSTTNQPNQFKKTQQESVLELDSNIPDLENPKVGNPITHSQILNLSKILKFKGREPYHLEDLLRGSKLCIPPPSPKPDLTIDYKNLMARLRQEEEARAYQRIINPLCSDTNKYHSPNDSSSTSFSSYRSFAFDEDDEVTYADVNRQMALILNVIVSIVACAAAIWMVAWYWSTPIRLALSMTGSILVGIAEVFIYLGYIRRVTKAKAKEKSVKEVKQVVKSWNIQANKGIQLAQGSQDSVSLEMKKSLQKMAVRRRR